MTPTVASNPISEAPTSWPHFNTTSPFSMSQPYKTVLISSSRTTRRTRTTTTTTTTTPYIWFKIKNKKCPSGGKITTGRISKPGRVCTNILTRLGWLGSISICSVSSTWTTASAPSGIGPAYKQMLHITINKQRILISSNKVSNKCKSYME